MGQVRNHILFLVSLLVLSACSSQETTNTATGGRVSPTYTGPSETAYCSTPITYSTSTITVSGTARYIRRELYNNPSSDPSFEGLGSALTTHATLPAGAYPIRAAEIRVTDAAGNVVQCGQTNSSDGSFSIILPAGNISYTLSVNSRSAQFNGGPIYLNASVLNRPEANRFYSLSTTVNAGGGNVNVGTLEASALSNGELLGAAFNILDQLFAANAFLRSKTSTETPCASMGCTAVTTSSPVPKVSAYWEKGFNPNDYFGSSSGLSFYLPGYHRLFILGGLSGDVDNSDTDHFDNSVILHEYGHFLEDVMFVSDSPGGSHNGNKVIDPRLAWSEGWGNFIQAAILTNNGSMSSSSPRYYDSSGNLDGTADLFFQVDLENMTGTDLVTSGQQGEGNFREFAVSRFLYDVVDGTGSESTYPSGSDNISNNFYQLWAALTSSTGFKKSTLAFRSIGNMLMAQQALSGASDWSAIRLGNYQKGNNSDYAQYVSTSGSCSTLSTGHHYSIDPTVAASGLSSSNLFLDNDFYHLKITSSGNYTLSLVYQDADSSGIEADLDLYLYNKEARFGNSSDIVGKSIADPSGVAGNTETESFTVYLTPGNYLINVNAYTGGTYSSAGPTQYSIRLNGVDLCPDSL